MEGFFFAEAANLAPVAAGDLRTGLDGVGCAGGGVPGMLGWAFSDAWESRARAEQGVFVGVLPAAAPAAAGARGLVGVLAADAGPRGFVGVLAAAAVAIPGIWSSARGGIVLDRGGSACSVGGFDSANYSGGDGRAGNGRRSSRWEKGALGAQRLVSSVALRPRRSNIWLHDSCLTCGLQAHGPQCHQGVFVLCVSDRCGLSTWRVPWTSSDRDTIPEHQVCIRTCTDASEKHERAQRWHLVL